MTDHQHIGWGSRHAYAIEYEYGAHVTNRTSVWRFCRPEDAAAFASVQPRRRKVVGARHHDVAAALARVKRGSAAFEEANKNRLVDGIYRLRL